MRLASLTTLRSNGCWDHARRKFKEAQAAQPQAKKAQANKASKADHMLQMINHLYKIERDINLLSAEEKYTSNDKIEASLR